MINNFECFITYYLGNYERIQRFILFQVVDRPDDDTKFKYMKLRQKEHLKPILMEINVEPIFGCEQIYIKTTLVKYN